MNTNFSFHVITTGAVNLDPFFIEQDVNLTPGVIWKISTGKCTSDDLKPVLQVYIYTLLTRTIDNKKWHWVLLSDGSYRQIGYIADEVFISKKLQEGSIVQLTKFQFIKGSNIGDEIRRYVL